MKSIRGTAVFLVSASILALGACAPNPPKDESEQLSATEGSWEVADNNALSPEEQHLRARQMVNPNDTSSTHSYTTTTPPPEAGETMNFRVLRLESQLADLRGDFDELLPPLEGMVMADEQLDQTIGDIQARKPLRDVTMPLPPRTPEQKMHIDPTPLAREAPQALAPIPETPQEAASAPVAAAAAEPVVETEAAAAPVPPVADGKAAVTGVRVGEHPGKTRLVLDMTAPGSFSYDLDNNERLLLIELPGTGWAGDLQKAFGGSHPLVKRYTAQDSGQGGTKLVVELNKPAKVTLSTAMKPNEVHGNRVVFDLSAM